VAVFESFALASPANMAMAMMEIGMLTATVRLAFSPR